LIVAVLFAFYSHESGKMTATLAREDKKHVNLLLEVISSDFEGIVSDLRILVEGESLQKRLNNSIEHIVAVAWGPYYGRSRGQ